MTKVRSDGRMMPRLIECVRKQYITPNLLRVTFSGEDLKGFPAGTEGLLIKLFFANQETGTLELPTRTEEKIYWPEHKPVSRAYTIRHFREDLNELDVDFVPHSPDSPASGWAINAQPGDKIGLGGPGGPQTLLPPADWHILAGDLTALPAISALLEQLPESAKGYAFVEVPCEEDIHALTHPAGVEVVWVVREVRADSEPLLDAIRTIDPQAQSGKLTAFLAGENDAVLACRKHLIEIYQLKKRDLHALPYWRRGQDEDEYHEARHDIMDEEY